jgi:Zn-dependent protease
MLALQDHTGSWAHAVRTLGIPLVLFCLFFMAAVRVVTKAGYQPWLAFLSLVPGLNIVLFFVFAFSAWPLDRALRAAARRPPAE